MTESEKYAKLLSWVRECANPDEPGKDVSEARTLLQEIGEWADE